MGAKPFTFGVVLVVVSDYYTWRYCHFHAFDFLWSGRKMDPNLLEIGRTGELCTYIYPASSLSLLVTEGNGYIRTKKSTERCTTYRRLVCLTGGPFSPWPLIDD